jgi:hypothetical protein
METITEEYRKLQQKLHENPNYGVASIAFAPIVAKIIETYRIKTLSDYGAGKKNLLKALLEKNIILEKYFPFDPAFPEYGLPTSSDLICCIDVLEHIEPIYIDNVLSELSHIVSKIGFFSIHMGPAGKFLQDGRNAHLIQEPTSWWLNKIVKYFEIIQLSRHQIMGEGFWLIVEPKVNK